MKKRVSMAAARAAWSAVLLAAGLCLLAPAAAATLDPERLPAIQAATFEVVSAKPVDDPLEYEKPLPYEQLPFQQRNDKYHSIGTAFSIGNGRYVTAAHVLLSGVNSLWGEPALRDNAGKVYAIDKVHKFSLEKDFVVFSLKERPAGAPLEVAPKPAPGRAVYSVGNAYGTGVVIRDGLYTSDTPEQQDGRWDWMRFSAAASPGNSGGPLVDEAGKVIGVVLAKSPNENLNYALPIAMVVNAPDGVGSIEQRIGYQFDVFDSTITDTLRASFDLPLPLARFFAEYKRTTNAWYDQQLAALLAQEKARLFPNGNGSDALLHSIATMGNFPKVVVRGGNDTWGVAGEERNDIRLSGNGHVTPGSYGNNFLFHLRRPDDIPAGDFYSDPQLPMGLLLQVGFLKRPFGNEQILVTSLGKPSGNVAHRDAWGRNWRLWTWDLAYANAKIAVLALPVPDGYVGVARSTIAMQEHDQAINMLALADFIYANYDGTLAQWKQFLAQPGVLPEALRDVDIDFSYGKHFRYDSGRLAFGYTPELQRIGEDSMLTLGFSFFRDGGDTVWDVAEAWVSAKALEDNYVMIVRNPSPPSHLGNDYLNEWSRLVERKFPYNEVPRREDDSSRITTVVAADGVESPSVLYAAYVSTEGSPPEDEIKGKLDRLLKDMKVKER